MKARPLPFFFAAVTLALALGLAPLLFSQAAAPALTLLSREGRRAVPIVLVNDQEFVGLDDLAPIFQLAVQEALGSITVSYKGQTIVLTPDQSLASVAGRLISLPAPPSRSGRRWLVPVEFISRALAPVYDTRVELRKPSRLLLVGDIRVPRIALRYDPLGVAGRLTIDATPAASSTVTQEGDRLVVRFDADALDLPSPLLPPPGPGAAPIVQGVRPMDAVTLGVDLAPRFGGFKSTLQPVGATMRLVLDLTPPVPTETAPEAAPPPPDLPPAFGPPPSALRTIAIDPGHGGDDEGVKGPAGAREKDLALAVARRLKAAIEGRLGVRVLLTRDDDRSVPIDDRTSVANNNKADLFVSLHASASARKSAVGAAIFTASFDREAAQAADTGGADRLPAFGGGLRDIDMVPWDLAQIRHLDRSTAFASLLEQQFRNRVPLAGRPTEQAPLRVLESANMPAVLVEVGYLSNAEQEKLLTGDSFQNTFVQAFYDAVVRFRDATQSGATR